MTILFGIAGLIVISIAVWIQNEKTQDLLFVVGGVFLLIYSVSIKNVISSVLQVVFTLSSLVEYFRLKK